MRDFELLSIFLGIREESGRNKRREKEENFKRFPVFIYEYIPIFHYFINSAFCLVSITTICMVHFLFQKRFFVIFVRE